MGHSFRISEFVIMMSSKIFVLALLAASTQAFKLKAIVRNTPEVTECMAGTSDWFSGISLNVSPYPVEVAAGKKITIVGEFPIPCLPINENLNLGSCEYELEKILYDLEASGKCEEFLPAGQSCSLPLAPGVYAGGDIPLEIELPEIPEILIPILSPLKALIGEVYGVLPDGTEIACLGATVDMTFG